MLRGPRILFPPPLIFVLAWFAGMFLDRWLPVNFAERPGDIVALLAPMVTAAGLVLCAAGISELLRARTGVLPFKPARALITTGPFRFSRNPIYLGLIITYLGVTAWTRLLWPLATLPAGLWVLRKTAIDPEEDHLSVRFGREYVDYCRQVRRWI